MIAQYRKKPVVISAVQWNGRNLTELDAFGAPILSKEGETLRIKKLEGEHIATVGDYIIMGISGEFYPCKPDIFEKTYERV